MSRRNPSQHCKVHRKFSSTGSSSGCGEEFARQYAAQGRPLVLVARRIEKLQALATELRERYRVDVMCPSEAVPMLFSSSYFANRCEKSTHAPATRSV